LGVELRREERKENQRNGASAGEKRAHSGRGVGCWEGT
jgi:hypothetical protein